MFFSRVIRRVIFMKYLFFLVKSILKKKVNRNFIFCSKITILKFYRKFWLGYILKWVMEYIGKVLVRFK